MEMKVMRVDGTVIDVESVGTSIWVEGKPAIQVMLRDITQRKQLEDEREQFQRKLEVKVEEKTRHLKEAQAMSNRLRWFAVALCALAATTVPTGRARDLARRRAQAARMLRKAIGRARRTIRAEDRSLASLRTFGDTAERSSLRGAGMKRLAMVEEASGSARGERAAIVKMKKHYESAAEQARSAHAMHEAPLAAGVDEHGGCARGAVWMGHQCRGIDSLGREATADDVGPFVVADVRERGHAHAQPGERDSRV
jgi:hypothetical protein